MLAVAILPICRMHHSSQTIAESFGYSILFKSSSLKKIMLIV